MAEAATLPVAGAKGPEKAETLDDLMLAMDVVDTLRHQENLVARELDEERRAAQLKERLRQIYKSQGLEVPDHVIEEGVKALKESRFLYTPPKPGLKRTLALMWVRRGRYGKWAVGGLAAIGLWWGISATTGIHPRHIDAAHAEVVQEAKVDTARDRARQILADGKAALAKGDKKAASKAIADLNALRDELKREYVLTVVSRPNEESGVQRTPSANRNARNFYLIVEAVAPDRTVLEITIPDEEQGKDVKVKKFGLRVPESVFDQVRRDKRDDGIVQNAKVGEKKRGELAVRYSVPVMGGMIARVGR